MYTNISTYNQHKSLKILKRQPTSPKYLVLNVGNIYRKQRRDYNTQIRDDIVKLVCTLTRPRIEPDTSEMVTF